jgi:hypothetical protein
VLIKPAIFKSSQCDMDKYRIYTFKKYMQRLAEPSNQIAHPSNSMPEYNSVKSAQAGQKA